MMRALLLVNFGGPRSLQEVEPFLTELLTDQEVIRTPWPHFFHRFIFSKVAKKRAPILCKHYALIGGKSPIYEDTEFLKNELSRKLLCPVLTFHRYLTETHKETFLNIENTEISKVLPLFPHFSYATTGSLQTLFRKKLKKKLDWIESYYDDHGYIALWIKKIKNFLLENNLNERETLLLFSAHSLPLDFIKRGDPYLIQIEDNFRKISAQFPATESHLAFQSRFGRGKWLEPDTGIFCRKLESQRKNVVFIPISFTSDHIETLYEIDYLYFPLIEKKGMRPFRIPAFNRDPEWVNVLLDIIEKKEAKISQIP